MWGGTRDEAGNPWRQDTVSLCWSTTKGILSTLVHILIDRGLLDYDAPMRRYWPEFGRAGKGEITLRQVLCHEAGLYGIGAELGDAREMLDWPHMVRVLERMRPAHEPGRAVGYHGLSFGWLVGELLERVTGEELGCLLKRELGDALGLDGLYLGLPATARSRRADVVARAVAAESLSPEERRSRMLNRVLGKGREVISSDEIESALLPPGFELLDWNSDELVGAKIPSICGFFTARSLARIYAAFASGEESGDSSLVSDTTLRAATCIQSREAGRVIPIQMNWRLGYHRIPAVRVKAPNAFGHFGIGGSGAWADPDRSLSLALVLNSGMGTPFGDTRIIRVGSAAMRAADARTLAA